MLFRLFGGFVIGFVVAVGSSNGLEYSINFDEDNFDVEALQIMDNDEVTTDEFLAIADDAEELLAAWSISLEAEDNRDAGSSRSRDLQQNLPQKGDTDCVLTDNLFSGILAPQSEASQTGSSSLVTSFLPFPSTCRNNSAAFGEIPALKPELPPLTELLPPFFNPSKNIFPILFSIALAEPVETPTNELTNEISDVLARVFSTTFDEPNRASNRNIVLKFGEEPKRLRRRKRLQERQEDDEYNANFEDPAVPFDGGEWALNHKRTELKKIVNLLPPSKEYSWWKVTLTYTIYRVDPFGGELVEEEDSVILREITRQVFTALQNVIYSNTLIREFIKSGINVLEVAMLGSEDFLPETLDLSTMNFDAAGKAGLPLTAPQADHYQDPFDPLPWNFRFWFGLFMFLATLSWVITLFIVSSKRQKLRKEMQWWSRTFSEDGLKDILRYGYRIERGGAMVIVDHGIKLGYNDDDSVFMGGIQNNLNTEIISAETILANMDNGQDIPDDSSLMTDDFCQNDLYTSGDFHVSKHFEQFSPEPTHPVDNTMSSTSYCNVTAPTQASPDISGYPINSISNNNLENFPINVNNNNNHDAAIIPTPSSET